MGQDSIDGDGSAGWRLKSSRYPTQQSLIAAIRQGDDAAIEQLFSLYAPMLREEARKLNVAVGDREHLVCTLLDDVAMRFIDNPIVPAALTTYVVKTLRNRVRTQHRNSARERATDDNAYAAYGGSREMVVAECHSEYGIRTSTGSDDKLQSSARSVLSSLAGILAETLSREDRILIVGVDRDIPLRELAGDLGVSHGAARVRLSRLRQRMARLAIEHVDSLPEAERQDLRRFLRRANVGLADTAAEQPPSEPGSSPQEWRTNHEL